MIDHGNASRQDRQPGSGFIAALDQSGGSTPRRSRAMASSDDAWSNDEEMFGLIHADAQPDHHLALLQRRQGDRRDPVRADDGRRGRRQAGAAGADRPRRGAVPQDRQGARGRGRRRPADEADARARRAARPRPRRTACSAPRCARSSTSPIRAASPRSSRSSSRSPSQILGHGLMPIIEPEVSIKSADRAAADAHPARRTAQGARRAARGRSR